MTALDLVLCRLDHVGAATIRDSVELITKEAYVEAIASGDPFYSLEAFMRRFDANTEEPELDYVIAYAGDIPIGQSWGWAFTDNDDIRTFALAQIMVRHAWTKHGVGRALHDELLRERQESQATLLTDSKENARAYNKYLKWGWQPVAKLRPILDSSWPEPPLFDVLTRPLPI